jgi:hypothetical protein
MKKCTKCFIDKELTEFNKSNKTRDGKRERCRYCQNNDSKKYYKNNKEELLKKSKDWRDTNKEYMTNYYIENKDKIQKYNKDYYLENKEIILSNSNNYYLLNKEKVIIRVSKYYQDNKEYLNEYHKMYKKEQYRKYPYIFAHRNILKRHLAFINDSKLDKTSELLGYSSNELKIYIESLFKDDMSWDNYGEWHIDHKKPLSKFDKTEKSNIVNALSNLQPLWAIDNLKKSNKYES